MALHVYRRSVTGSWDFSQEGGPTAILNLSGAAEKLSIPLAEIYEFAMPSEGIENP